MQFPIPRAGLHSVSAETAFALSKQPLLRKEMSHPLSIWILATMFILLNAGKTFYSLQISAMFLQYYLFAQHEIKINELDESHDQDEAIIACS